MCIVQCYACAQQALSLVVHVMYCMLNVRQYDPHLFNHTGDAMLCFCQRILILSSLYPVYKTHCFFYNRVKFEHQHVIFMLSTRHFILVMFDFRQTHKCVSKDFVMKRTTACIALRPQSVNILSVWGWSQFLRLLFMELMCKLVINAKKPTHTLIEGVEVFTPF